MNKIKKIISLFTLCLTLLFVSLFSVPQVAKANSAQIFTQGITDSGVVMTDIESPLVVESENLNFKIKTAELSLENKVSAEYSILNPTNYEVTSKLVFPFIIENSNDVSNVFSPSNYKIYVDNTEVEKTLRWTNYQNHSNFVISNELKKLNNTYNSNEYLSENTTVYQVSYVLDTLDPAYSDKYSSLDYALTLESSNSVQNKARSFILSCYSSVTSNAVECIYTTRIQNNANLTVFYLGEESYNNAPKIDVNCKGTTVGTVKEDAKKTYSFKEFVLNQKDITLNVGDVDYFNAVFDEIQSRQNNEYSIPRCLGNLKYESIFLLSLTPWFEYNITVPAKTIITNTVEAPMFPMANYNCYNYKYLLSPLKTWSSFGAIKVNIETDLVLHFGNNYEFQKTETGYTSTIKEFNGKELEFSIYKNTSNVVNEPYFQLIAIIFLFITLIASDVYLIILLTHKKKNNQGTKPCVVMTVKTISHFVLYFVSIIISIILDAISGRFNTLMFIVYSIYATPLFVLEITILLCCWTYYKRKPVTTTSEPDEQPNLPKSSDSVNEQTVSSEAPSAETHSTENEIKSDSSTENVIEDL